MLNLGGGDGVAYAFDHGGSIGGDHAGGVVAVGKAAEHQAGLAQQAAQGLRLGGGQLPDGVDADAVQLAGGGAADEQQFAHRQGIQHPGAVFIADHAAVSYTHLTLPTSDLV